MKWKKFLGDYFTFTRKERIGLLVLILVIVGIWVFPKVWAPTRAKPSLSDTSWVAAARKLMVKAEDSEDSPFENVDNLAYNKPLNERPERSKGQLFYFDPNVLSFEGWTKLGVREKTIATIQNYLNKGGHFYKTGDLKKIYGIHPDEYSRLEPYVKIPAIKLTQTSTGKQAEFQETSSMKPKVVAVDINTADTSAFVALPGIGSKLASRIINFRDKLGGFYSVDQIGETYGLPDSTFQKIKPYLRLEMISIKKININTATKDEMKSHPYLKWNLANAIVEYRTQHGNFSSLEDLKKISLISTEVFEKIKFYLTL